MNAWPLHPELQYCPETLRLPSQPPMQTFSLLCTRWARHIREHMYTHVYIYIYIHTCIYMFSSPLSLSPSLSRSLSLARSRSLARSPALALCTTFVQASFPKNPAKIMNCFSTLTRHGAPWDLQSWLLAWILFYFFGGIM